jgi:hypothetical protein
MVLSSRRKACQHCTRQKGQHSQKTRINPAKMPAAMTLIVDDKLRPPRALLAAMGDGSAVLPLVETTDKTNRMAIAKKNEMAQCRMERIVLLVER